MKYRIFVYIILIFISLQNFCWAKENSSNERITIPMALDLANKHNPAIEKFDIQMDILGYDLYNTYAGYLPQVNYQDRSERIKMNYDTEDIEDRGFRSGMKSFTIDQDISVHKFVPEIMQKHKEKSARSYALLDELFITKLKVIQAFVDVYKNQKLLPIINEIEENLKKQLEIGQIKLDYDHIKSSDFKSLGADLAEAIAEKIKISNGLDIAKNTYTMLVGAEHTNLELDRVLQLPYQDISSFVEAVTVKNAKILASQEGATSAKYMLASKTANLLPDVNIGYANTFYKNLWYMPGYPDLTHNAYRVDVRIPIFDGGKSIVGVGRQVKELKLANLNSQITYEEVVSSASHFWSQYEVYSQMITRYEQSLKALEEILTQKQLQFNNDRGSFMSVLDAKRNMLAMKMKLIDAKCEKVLIYYKILSYVS